jgi:hypothetical protein
MSVQQVTDKDYYDFKKTEIKKKNDTFETLEKAGDNESLDAFNRIKKMNLLSSNSSTFTNVASDLATVITGVLKASKSVAKEVTKNKDLLLYSKNNEINNRLCGIDSDVTNQTTMNLSAEYNGSVYSLNAIIRNIWFEITPENQSPILKVLPKRYYNASQVVIPRLAPIQGYTNTNNGNKPLHSVQLRSLGYDTFSAFEFAEKIDFDAEMRINLRKPDSEMFNDSGWLFYRTLAYAQLMHRSQSRDVLYAYDTLYNGCYNYDGVKIPFRVLPNTHINSSSLTPSGLPMAYFTTGYNGIPQISQRSAADFIIAIQNLSRTWLKWGWSKVTMITDSMTMGAIITNETINLVNSFGYGTAIANGSMSSTDYKMIFKRFLPIGIDLDIEIDDSAYYPDENDLYGRPASTSQPYKFNHEGKALFIPSLSDRTGIELGETMCTPYAFGSVENPRIGTNVVEIDTGMSNLPDEYVNPKLSVILKTKEISAIITGYYQTVNFLK